MPMNASLPASGADWTAWGGDVDTSVRDLLAVPPGASLGPMTVLVISADMPSTYRTAAANAGSHVFVCSGTNDQVQINAAIDLAAPLNARNSTSPAGAQQWGTVQLTGGRFSVSSPILMRTGVKLRGMGELTQVRAVSLSATTGYPAGVAAIIKQVAVTDHVCTVQDMWIDGNFAAGGGTCHGIAWAGPGGNSSGYPDSNPDPSMHIRDVRLTNFTTGTRHGIWLQNNLRAGHYHNIWVRNCSGNGFFADSTPDSVLSFSDFGGCAVGVRIAGANWRVNGVKTYYSGLNGGSGVGFEISSGRHALANIETQDDVIGIIASCIKTVWASVNINCCQTDGIIVSGSKQTFHGVSIHQYDPGRFSTWARGLVWSGTLSDVHFHGFVEKQSGTYTITTPVSGTTPTVGNRNVIRVSVDSPAELISVG